MPKPTPDSDPIAPVSDAEVLASAKTFNLELTPDEAAMYAELMGPMADDYRRVAAMAAPKLPVKYPRDRGFRPRPEDNPLNAWYWKSTIRGAGSGKLSGKTLVVKDNVCVAEVPLMNGSAVLEGFVPDEDATVITRVLDAGGEILGKAVCENFCFSGGSHTSATGPVENPRKPGYMAGGSSSGCAALLVAGECDMAIGGDQGGSIRMPSSFSGCYGIKPTYGLVPYTGALPIDYSVDHLGPMAMSTYDCALLLEVIAGYDDGLDPRQSPDMVAKQYTEALTGDAQGLRIGIVNEGFGTPLSEPDVDAAVRKAAQRFDEVGATVDEVSIPKHAEAPGIMFSAILEGSMVTFSDTSGAGTVNKGHYLTEGIRFYERHRKERAALMPITVKTVLLFGHIMRERYGTYYSAKAHNLVRTVRDAYDHAFRTFDLLVMPTTVMKAHPLPAPDATEREILTHALDMTGNTAPFDITGHPSMSVPCGESDGLPIGMMLTGRNGEDDVVLRAGHAFEQLR